MGRIIRTVSGCLHAVFRTNPRRRRRAAGCRRPTRFGIVCLWILGLAVMFTSPPASARSPVPFFRQVERVGVLCTVDAAFDAAAGVPEDEWLCRLAREELAAALAPDGTPGGWEVVALSRNDERLADPATLAVLLHANTRGQPAGPALTAFAAALHRSGAGAPPLFLAPPEAVAGLSEDQVRAALRRLLAAAAARPLLANR